MQRKRLIIEITESAKLEDPPKAARAVDQPARARVTMCASTISARVPASLPYLQQLQVDFVKIDGAYIRSITDSIRERAIVQGVLTTCRCLNIKTVAEMVEKEDQHKCLLELGVDLGSRLAIRPPGAGDSGGNGQRRARRQAPGRQGSSGASDRSADAGLRQRLHGQGILLSR